MRVSASVVGVIVSIYSNDMGPWYIFYQYFLNLTPKSCPKWQNGGKKRAIFYFFGGGGVKNGPNQKKFFLESCRSQKVSEGKVVLFFWFGQIGGRKSQKTQFWPFLEIFEGIRLAIFSKNLVFHFFAFLDSIWVPDIYSINIF